MPKRTLSILLILLLIGMSVLLNTKPVNAFETIFIRADGSIDPATAPIQRNGSLYILTEDITSDANGIVIERNDMTINGEGYALHGSGGYTGIYLDGRNNITIQNMEITSFYFGFYALSSSNINLSNNNAIANTVGIEFQSSSNSNVNGNNVTANTYVGLWLFESSNITLRSNKMTNNKYNFGTEGFGPSNFIHDIDTSNTIDDKPIYYWMNKQDLTVPTDASYVALVNCKRIMAQNLSLSHNVNGILLANTTDATVLNNDITYCRWFDVGLLIESSNNYVMGNNVAFCENEKGILIADSSNNFVIGNNITANWEGIIIDGLNNKAYHNNFINNVFQAYSPTVSIWDDGYPSGGNYWSDYSGTDSYSGPYQNETGSDGIGDTPYIIDINNQDNYPLIDPLTSNTTDLEQLFVALVNGARAFSYDLELENIAQSHYAYRSGGSTGATETANWIKEQFQSFELEAWLEPFEFTTWDLSSKPSLIIDDDGNANTTFDQTIINSFQCEQYSWPTLLNGAFADLVVLPLPVAANRGEIGMNPINTTAWNAIDTTGKILLIGREVRWSSSWNSAYINKLTAQTPLAVVHTWWYDWMSFTPAMIPSTGGRPLSTLGSYYWNLEIPIGSVNYYDGLWIRNRETTLGVSANVSINSVIGSGTHYNVVGKIEGYEEPEKTVIVSAHYDTVMTNGFGDNGAGTAGVIELAKVFADTTKTGFYKPKYTLLFIAFTDEELCFIGAINYIRQHKSEMANIVAVINLDCIGSDDFYVTETDPADGMDLDEVVLQAAEDLGIPASLESPGGSDQEAFRSPSDVNYYCNAYWGVDPEIGDATPVASSALLISMPVMYSDMWNMGASGWIHTSYDNSTSTSTLNWIEVEDLENHIKIAALTMVRISPHVVLQGHDVAVINVTPYKTIVGQAYSVWINVTVENQGGYTESFGVTVYADTTAINTFASIVLPSGHTTTITLSWNTTSFTKGNYTISATAETLLNETDTDDNTATDGNIFVGIPGDIVAAYGLVDMKDIGTAVKAFGSVPGHPKWNPNADINNDNKVDMKDIGITVQHFGQTEP